MSQYIAVVEGEQPLRHGNDPTDTREFEPRWAQVTMRNDTDGAMDIFVKGPFIGKNRKPMKREGHTHFDGYDVQQRKAPRFVLDLVSGIPGFVSGEESTHAEA